MSNPGEVPAESTPLMKQYLELKSQVGDALLFFRMGDFYELFAEDAVEAARILEITLTSRDRNKPNPMPMAGVPWHSAQGYIQRLLKAGKKVAIGEQVEDPATVKNGKIVRREIVRILTPGIHFDIEGSGANFVAAISPRGADWVLACLDVSTGEALVSEPLSGEALAAELGALPIRHLLRIADRPIEDSEVSSAIESASRTGTLVEELPSNYLALGQAEELLRTHYELASLAAFLTSDAGVLALGVLVTYALRTQQLKRLSHLRLPEPLRKPRTLVLSPRSAQHLDLLPSSDGTPNLYDLINRTRSALGARELKRWCLAPLKDPAEIRARQNALRELTPRLADSLSAALAEVYDLERISGRVQARLANPRDTLALGRSLATLDRLAANLSGAQSDLLVQLREKLLELHRELAPLSARIVRTQREEAPLTARDGGIFNRGTTPELDHLLSLSEDGQQWLIDLETRERAATGIPSLKVRYNRVFGYYIEVTQSHLKNVPAHYQRKQTTVGAERFFSEELKKFEDEFVNATAKQKSLEQSYFEELLESIRGETARVMTAAQSLARLDALVALSRLAGEPGWVFPAIDESLELSIELGRHPLVDRAGVSGAGTFVPNDVALSPATRMTLVITGPNMGGKSTVMRQTALIVILGQMGAPVPAKSARWGSVSSVFTRIGAHDAIARGQSTFMVEMSELAHILHHADERALIVLDEIGRGTSTYDGISVAWATLEWIATQVKARTLFATHYHELTRLSAAGGLPGLANAHMAVDGGKDLGNSKLRFLYKLREGAANESFGIHVARIAGLPRPVVERAWEVLEDLEKTGSDHPRPSPESVDQLSLFSVAPKKPTMQERAAEIAAERAAQDDIARQQFALGLLTDLQAARVEEMTPLQALNFIAKIQQSARESGPAS